MGDAAGIGPEIIARYFAAENPSDLIVVGDLAQMKRAIRLIGADMAVIEATGPEAAKAGAMAVHPVGVLPDDLPCGMTRSSPRFAGRRRGMWQGLSPPPSTRKRCTRLKCRFRGTRKSSRMKRV
jgi:hypothetical protein